MLSPLRLHFLGTRDLCSSLRGISLPLAHFAPLIPIPSPPLRFPVSHPWSPYTPSYFLVTLICGMIVRPYVIAAGLSFVFPLVT
jgi:hypothetical protein